MTRKKAKVFEGKSEQEDRDLSNDEKAQVLELFLNDPDTVVEQVAKAERFPVNAVRRFLARLKTRHVGTVAALKQASTFSPQGFIAALEEKAQSALYHITDEKLAEAGPKENAIVLGILVEKAQLLRGRPTAILSFEERLHVQDLIPVLIKEAQRRGMFIDATATTVIENGDEIEAPRVIPGDEVQRETVDMTYRRVGRHVEDEEVAP